MEVETLLVLIFNVKHVKTLHGTELRENVDAGKKYCRVPNEKVSCGIKYAEAFRDRTIAEPFKSTPNLTMVEI